MFKIRWNRCKYTNRIVCLYILYIDYWAAFCHLPAIQFETHKPSFIKFNQIDASVVDSDTHRLFNVAMHISNSMNIPAINIQITIVCQYFSHVKRICLFFLSSFVVSFFLVCISFGLSLSLCISISISILLLRFSQFTANTQHLTRFYRIDVRRAELWREKHYKTKI